MKNFLKKIIKKSKFLTHIVYLVFRCIPDKTAVKMRYKMTFNKKIDLNNPQTLNEKIQWLKLNDHRNLNTLVADKFAVREYIKSVWGEEYLIPLLFYTKNAKDINEKNITTFPCIVKCNNGSHSYKILRSKEDVNWKQLQKDCKYWMKNNLYWISKEWQYKNIKSMIVVEKLLTDKNGKIPNDYKLNFINGKFEFIYCSVDREMGNYRVCYNEKWEKQEFIWCAPGDYRPDINNIDIPKPVNFEKMIELGSIIAKNYPYVRVDFYEVESKLYFGEITLHHGGGFDTFTPAKYDKMFGEKLDLTTLKELS